MSGKVLTGHRESDVRRGGRAGGRAERGAAGAGAGESQRAAAESAGAAAGRVALPDSASWKRVLEGAVEHGASLWRDRLQVVLPAQTLLLDNARVIGYRIEDYGIFFNVEVPSLETTMTWAVRTLDQNDLGLESALKAVKAHIEAIRRRESRSGVAGASSCRSRRPGLRTAPHRDPAAVPARTVSGSAAFAADTAVPADPTDPILSNPEDVFRAEVVQSLIDGMLDHSSALGLGAGRVADGGCAPQRSPSQDRPARQQGADIRHPRARQRPRRRSAPDRSRARTRSSAWRCE